MAATLTNRQTDKARALIQSQRLIQELQKHVLGDRDMSPTQVRAAQILLDRSMPCLQATIFSVEGDAALPLLTIVPSNASAAA